jgi:hypothetical protein
MNKLIPSFEILVIEVAMRQGWGLDMFEGGYTFACLGQNTFPCLEQNL